MDERLSGIYELESYHLAKAPPTAYYFPNFITVAEEAFLLQQVYNAPKPKWVHLSGRKLQNWGGLPHPRGMLAESLPDWLKKYAEKISFLGLFDGKVANHVLVNEYLPGEGIMPHVDGPLYFPTVTTISLGSHTVLDFYHPVSKEQDGDGEQVSPPQTQEERYLLSLLVEPRSLLVLKEDMYKHYLHGIRPVSSDDITDKVANIDSCLSNSGETLSRGTRVSLTIRHVPKVLKTTIALGTRK